MEQKDDHYDQYLDKLMKRPRISGYKHYLPLIDKLKKLGVWSIIIETRSNKILKKISQIFKIDYRTIKNWKLMLKGDRNWIPDHKRKNTMTRVFTEEQFETLLLFIKALCRSQKIIITNKLIHSVTMSFYANLQNPPCPKLLFNASDKFIIRLKSILDYSSRRLQLRRVAL